MAWFRAACIAALSMVLVAGCASSQQRARREQREKAMQSSKLYCEFLNGEQYPDLDVALNLSMAQRCDSEKSFSLTSYKTPAEIPGIMYCCALRGHNPPAQHNNDLPAKTSSRESKHEIKAADLKPVPPTESKSNLVPVQDAKAAADAKAATTTSSAAAELRAEPPAPEIKPATASPDEDLGE